ncbi:MAG: ABC transporter ATP-binding protein [Spirochaetaceae bacterium]|nr:MAG: ABC transporter ATP-binding protein [Spirochaetaceae bacterium]
MGVVETKNLSKYYGRFLALNGVSLSLDRGEILGLIGPNGAGKTTTVRILLGLLRRSGGEATLFGKDAWADSVEIHRRLAYVPGEVQLWPNLTGGEVIDFLAHSRGGIDKNRRSHLLERFDLDPTKKCKSYSKGNRQKVGLVAAFASDAELFILDEPTSGLDPLMSSVFQECLLEMKKEGRTVLMSSHILADVEKLCDRVSIIRKGTIVETGSLEEMRHIRRNVFSVTTETPVSGLDKIDGVHDLEQNGTHAVFQLENDKIDAVMAHVMKSRIRYMTSVPPTLEQLFMRHYGDELAEFANAKGRQS